jgi:4-hydroxybenzoate polyprenyltransferase
LSDFPILDLTDNKYIVCGKKYYKFGQQKPKFFTKVKYIIKQLRIKHYVKNGLIFLPLFFSSALTNPNLIINSIMGFIAFCLIFITILLVL